MNRQGTSINGRIHLHYTEIPKAERKLADLLLDFPGDVAAYSATELADLAGVSKAAATRLFRRLGFNSFEEARKLARDARNWGSPLYMHSVKPVASDFEAERQSYLEDETHALSRTLNALQEKQVDEIILALSTAPNLWMAGFRYNQIIAAYGHWQFLQFRKNVHLLPGVGQTLGEFTSLISENDVVILAGFRRRTPELLKLMQIVSDNGARILYLTDETAGKTASLATWTLRCTISGNFMFDTYSPALSVMRYLSLKTFTATGKPARTRLETIEQHHARLAELA